VNNNSENDEMKRWLRREHRGLHTNFWCGMLSQLGTVGVEGNLELTMMMRMDERSDPPKLKALQSGPADISDYLQQ
jgi:hypothetical protein